MGKNVDPNETRAVFVVWLSAILSAIWQTLEGFWLHILSVVLQDECACIGCKMCVWCASGTFRIHDQHGRSRVFAQWVDTEEKIEV